MTSAAVRLVQTAGGSGIGFENVTVSYGGVIALDCLNLEAKPGEIVALIGPSGSGKTTALRAVAGFVKPTSGRIRIGERDVTFIPPRSRDIGMVVQNYALFPHMRVEENVAFGLRARGAPSEVIAQRVPECLRMVGMSAYLKRYPRELSGGQQQRVAIARALAIRPRVLLLDEPLSALDAQIRRSMLEEIAKLHRELPQLTILYVTHDQTEALTLANHIGIMHNSQLVAFGSSRSLYRFPPNRFSAEFLGRANLMPVTDVGATNASGLSEARFGNELLAARNHHNLQPGSNCLLCIRPHDVHVNDKSVLTNCIRGVVSALQWQGEMHNVSVAVGETIIRLTCKPMMSPPELGSAITVSFNAEDATLIAEDTQ